MLTVIKTNRACEWFESHRPGLSFAGHLDVQERRRDWIRTAGVALAAAVIGGAMTMIAALVALSR